MSIVTIIIIAGLGISFIFSVIVLAALAVSSRAGRMEAYIEEHYEFESDSYGINNSWAAES